ncbi:MAG: hypothetical protein JXQ82_07745 [Methanomicrobiaceae archaeon]|nr:hypothetical protein [Methanomicrobiaceae archaeon]
MTVEVEDVRYEITDISEPYFFTDSRIQKAIDEAEGLLSERGVSSDRRVRLHASLDLIDIRLAALKNRAAISIAEGKKSVTYQDLIQIRNIIQEKLERETSQASGCFSVGYNI